MTEDKRTIYDLLVDEHKPNMVYRCDISYDTGKTYKVYKMSQDVLEVANFIETFVNREQEKIRIKVEKFIMEKV